MAGKLKIAGVWTGTMEVNLLEWTVSRLREQVGLISNSNPNSINLIWCGRLLKDDPLTNQTLSDLGLKNNAKILTTKTDADVGHQLLAQEQRSSALARLKAAVSALAKRHADDGSLPIEDYDIQLEDQSGQKLNLGSQTDQSAIMMGLMLHTKAKQLMSLNKFQDALEVLLMAEEAFSLCDQTLIERVDNVSILQIDMVWCYFMLRDINLLSAAGERLAKAKLGIERSHGKDGSRVRLLHTSRSPELALYLRLELLEGVAAFHSGQLEKSRQAFTSAKAKFSKLQVSDEALSLLISMGYRQQEATRALKLNEQDIESAVNFLEEEKEKRAKKHADDLKRQKEIREQKKYGKTPLGKAVDMQKLDALVSISFEKELAAEALRIHENDAAKALDDLTDPTTKSKMQHDIESKKRKRHGHLEARIAQLASMGFDQSKVKAALDAHGTTSEALDELLKQVGQDADPSVSEYMRAALDTAASSSGVGGGESSNSSDGDNPSTSANNVEERDVEIENELAEALGGKDALSDYDIDVTKEGEALNEYLALLDSALDAGKPSSQ